MNFGHLHLMLNHIPILVLPIVLIFLFFSYLKDSQQFIRFSILMTFLTSITVLPVFYTGEPAEEVIKKEVTSISKSVIHDHEESAELSLILTLIVGLSSIVVLLKYQHPLSKKYGVSLILLIGLVAIGSLIYSANLGGKIRHTEFVSEQ
jgi:uncharacterized membrane protein